MIKEFRDNIVRWKFRVSYLSGFITTFAGILIITNTLQEKLAGLGYPINYLIMLPVILVMSLIGAYILDRVGFIESEIDYSNTKNRMLREIHKK